MINKFWATEISRDLDLRRVSEGYLILQSPPVCNWLQPLQRRHNDHDGISNHLPHGCLLNRLFSRRSKKTSKLRVTGLSVGNSPGTGEFPAQMASYAENVSIWWRHHGILDRGYQGWIWVLSVSYKIGISAIFICYRYNLHPTLVVKYVLPLCSATRVTEIVDLAHCLTAGK